MATSKSTQSTRLAVQKTYKLFIGGAFPRTESGRYFQATDAKGNFVANICQSSRKDFRNAVVAARKAQSSWAKRSAFNRAQILYRMAEMLESRRANFEQLLVEIAGYKSAQAQQEVDTAIDRLVWYAGWSDKFPQVFGATNPVASPHFNFTFPEPIGVVAALAPKNSPLVGLVSAIAPVIVSGNTIVLVVDNSAPQLAIDLAEVLHCSDLPGGVVNILTGQRDELIAHVSSHMDVDAVLAFGASNEEKITISTQGAESVKQVYFQKDPAQSAWQKDDMQSPYWILPFVEFKTAWHPMGF